MQAFCPSAGLGTRLTPLTRYRAKPLLPVLGIPVFLKVLDTLRSSGVRRVVANRHHLPTGFDTFLPPHPLGLDLLYSDEQLLLDTGGGLAEVMRSQDLGETFFYHNADIILETNLKAALASHLKGPQIATLLVDGAKGKRNVPMAEDRRILGFRERIDGIRSVTWCGVGILSQRVRDFFPRKRSFCVLDALVEAIRAGELVLGFPLHPGDYWCDIGTVPMYSEVQSHAAQGLFSMPVDCGAREIRNHLWAGHGATVPPDTQVRGYAAVGSQTVLKTQVLLENTIVWDACTVAPGVSLRDCIVTDRTRVDQDCQNGIVSRDGITFIRP